MKDNQKSTDMTFSELRCKEIINSVDGRRLGRAVDIVFDVQAGLLRGIIAPYSRKTWTGRGQDIFIPLKCVQKVGEDVILVDLDCDLKPPPKHPCHHPSPCSPPCPPITKPECIPCSTHTAPDCDGKCEKCTLIDCVYRWKR